MTYKGFMDTCSQKNETLYIFDRNGYEFPDTQKIPDNTKVLEIINHLDHCVNITLDIDSDDAIPLF